MNKQNDTTDQSVEDILNEAERTGDMLKKEMGEERYDKIFRVMHGECSIEKCKSKSTKQYTVKNPTRSARHQYVTNRLCKKHVKPFVDLGLVIREEDW